MEFEMSLDIFNQEAFEELFKINNTEEVSVTGTYNIIEKVQCKKHKKSRINKKWLKRYGYKEIITPVEINFPRCSIKESENGTYELTAIM